MPVKIRRAVAGDRQFIFDLSEECFAHFGDFYPELIASRLGQSKVICFIAVSENESPLGYAMANHREAGILEIEAIAVNGGEQKRGIGRSLLAKIETHARANPNPTAEPWALELWVSVENSQARSFFESAGFQITNEIPPENYRNGDRPMRMRKILVPI